ncbi:MAG: acyltransferase [Rhodobacteraceae bacterium]|nr:acyltransferase [Paracoccaceae bacterium]
MSLIKYRQDIQILRGIAVTFVVLYHVKLAGFANGLLGVDVFFVVSGYLMAQLYDKRSPSEFLLARLNRLLPAYVLVTLLTLAAAFFVTVPSDYAQVAGQSSMAAAFLSNFYYWNQSSYFQSQDFNPLLNYWSLAVEVQFYLVVPFLFPLLRRHKSLAIGVFLVSLALCLAVLTKSEKTSFFMLPTRVWEFMLGAFAAWYGQKAYGKVPMAGVAMIVVLVAFVFLFPLAQGTTNVIFGHPSLAALGVTLLTAGVLVTGLPRGLEQSLPGRALTQLGNISYSVYLVHFPIIVLVNYVPFGGTVLGYPSLPGLALILGLTFALAIPLYAFVERSRRFRLERLPRVLPVFVVLAVVAIGAGQLRMLTLPATERNIVNALEDNNQRRCPLSFRVMNPTERLCFYGPENTGKRIALIGDSHAVSIRDQFVEQAAARGYGTYFAVHNRPLLDKRFPVTGMDEQLNDPRLQAVVLHYRITRLERPGGREHVEEFVRRSLEHGVPVVLIAPIPDYPDLVPRYMYTALMEEAPFDGMQISREETRERNTVFWDMVADLPSEGVTVIDPTELLCTDGSCNYFDDALHPYYYDKHHLTLTGAAKLAPDIEKVLDSIDSRVAEGLQG